MEDIESARKKRKLEDGVTASTQNHVTNGNSSVRTSVAAPTRTQSHLQFNPTVIQRLRQITKDCQKNFSPAPKPNGGKLTFGTENTAETTPEKNARTAAADSGDFIISSAGSSPAHSPKPMEFEVLSTPPRPARPTESDTKEAVPIETVQNSNDGRHHVVNACSKLVDPFADLSSNRTLINGVSPSMRTLGPDFSSVEVLEEGNQPFCKDSTPKTRVTVNGEVNLQGTTKKNLIHLNSEEQNSPALADVEPTVNAEENGGANYNSEDFRQMVKKMIAERMTQIERSMGVENQERIASLERENTALKEYARKVEDSVKTILAAEKERAKLKVTRAIQTQDPHWLTNLRSTKAVTATPLQSTVTVSRPSSMGLTFTTTPTPRLTSTVAPLPGHTVPSRHENTPLSYRPGLQRPLAEPVRPRIPGTSPRIPQPSVSYIPNYDPGPAGRSEQPDQHGGNRASAPGPNLSSSVHPRLNGVTVRAPTLGAQPPRPVMRMQAPIVSPGGPRSIAPPSSRPLPTVTVHPQTQTPSSVTSVRVQQEPPSYGYANQNAYNSGPPGPRFASAPQVRPQGSQHLQGVPPQISPSHRTPVYPQSPLQASPPQRIMQQQQPMRPEQQNAQIPRPSIQIRAGPPVQMQSSPHAINQQHRSPQPQQPDLARYQSVGGPPRQAIAAHPQPNYGTVSIRQTPPATGGMQPAAVQQPPPPAIVRSSPSAQVKEPPPKPSVSIAVVTSGIVLSWNMVLEEKHAPIMNYQLFALQDGGTAENPHQWKKIGVVKALPLPMACTLTQFLPGNKYHFAVRGTDEMGRLGPFSDPCTITLK